MNQKDKSYQLIESHVASYRAASASARRVEKFTGSLEAKRSLRAYVMQMDRASGALDILFELFPNSEAWRDTKWIY